MAPRGPREELRRLDLRTESAGLPASLIAAIEADGGLWGAGDYYTDPEDVVAQARAAGAVALRLDVRDLTFLEHLADVRYLHVRTDGRPVLDPISALRGLRALILETGAQRGDLDVLAFPELRWLKVGLGGKGGAVALAALERGHRALEWLAVSETRARTVPELVAGLPALTHLSVHFADDLRELGDLPATTPRLVVLRLQLTRISTLAGIDAMPSLEVLDVMGGRVTDLAPVGRALGLRYGRILTPDVSSIEPLRAHPTLRIIELKVRGQPDTEVLDTIPNLVAVGRGRDFDGPIRQADLFALPTDHPFREEWRAAMRR